MQLRFLGDSYIKIGEIPTCTILNKGWVLDFRANKKRVKIAESNAKSLYNS